MAANISPLDVALRVSGLRVDLWVLAPPGAAAGAIERAGRLRAFLPATVAVGVLHEEPGMTQVTAGIRVLASPVRQGAGALAKFALRLTLEAGADAAALVHHDGRASDTTVALLLERFAEGHAAVVSAQRPATRRLLRRFLAWLDERLTGLAVADLDFGARVYATRLLRRVPFEQNTNGPNFDTELLLQAAYVGEVVVGVPVIATDPVAPRPPGTFRAATVSSLQFRAHRLGVGVSLRYRDLEPSRYRDKTSALYSSHALALREVARLHPATACDVGCGPGFLASRCEALGVRVTGIDYYGPLPNAMSAFVQHDLEQLPLPIDPFAHDLVLLLDVLEHLANPEAFLMSMRNTSRAQPDREGRLTPLLLSTPNVAFVAVRVNLVLGRFNYAERGILDITHKRLFTRASLERTLCDAGYDIDQIVPVPVPFAVVVAGSWGRLLQRSAAVLAWLWPTMFAFQWLVLARPRCGLRQLVPVGEPVEGEGSPYG